MTNDQINHAISQLYGWSANYCTDLNAMHEAEKSIPDELWNCYFNQLARVTKAEQSDDRVFFCASARHRAEAFLRTLGKWEPVVKECFTTEADLLRDVTKMVGEVQP